ncbi:MAG: hypothetical protein CK538_08155, partial [Opitutia bacterium]
MERIDGEGTAERGASDAEEARNPKRRHSLQPLNFVVEGGPVPVPAETRIKAGARTEFPDTIFLNHCPDTIRATVAKGERERSTRTIPRVAPTTDRAEGVAAFARMDTNHDGVLTLAEYVAGIHSAPNLAQRFKNFDKNGDG